jgi:hypothetical protein
MVRNTSSSYHHTKTLVKGHSLQLNSRADVVDFGKLALDQLKGLGQLFRHKEIQRDSRTKLFPIAILSIFSSVNTGFLILANPLKHPIAQE